MSKARSSGTKYVQVCQLGPGVGRSSSRYSNSDVKAIGRAKVVLDDGSMHGSVTRDGGFTMCVVCDECSTLVSNLSRPDVPEGTYILSVLAHDHLFDQVRLSAP